MNAIERTCLSHYATPQNQASSCGGHVVRNIMFVEQYDEVVRRYIEDRHGHYIRNDKILITCRFPDELDVCWTVLPISENVRGYRAHRALVDSRISDEIFQDKIYPLLSIYSKSLEWF